MGVKVLDLTRVPETYIIIREMVFEIILSFKQGES
jgi:hypothetical protein